MSALTVLDVEQRSPEWYEARRGIVTASTIGSLLTTKTVLVADNVESRSLVCLLASERITGRSEDTYQSAAMWRGVMDEPLAVATYAEHIAPVHHAGFMVRDFGGYRIGYSPDGMVGDDGLIEVKSREPKTHVQHVTGGVVPQEHMAQIQCGLLVSGRTWCDYVSYCGGLPMWVTRVERDERWMGPLIEAAYQAEKAIRLLMDAFARATAGAPQTERIDYDDMVI